MLARFVALFASRPRASVIAWLAVLVFGLVSYFVLLPREGFPPVDVPIAVTAGGYFVDDADRVDDDVTIKIADELGAMAQVESVQSYSRPSSFSVIANLADGTTSAQGAAAIRARLAQVELPPEAVVAVNSIDAARFLEAGYDLLVGVYGAPDTTAPELETAAHGIVDRFVHPDIASATVEELIESGIDPTNGETITRQTGFNQLSGQDGVFRPSIAVGIKAPEGVDSLALSDAVKAKLDEIRAAGALPDGYEAVIAIDFATTVREQVGSLQRNVLTGIVAVALVALVLISWRASVITAVFIITVLAASLAALYLAGMTLNTISLFGLILALGLFVDDAIVITEAIDAFRSEGDDDLTIIKRAIRRVGSASVSGTLTTVLVFAPMLLISGILGGFIRILPITIIIALVISLLLSLIFIPVATRFLVLRAPRSDGPLARAGDRIAAAVAGLPRVRGPKGIAIALAGFALSLAMFLVGVMVFAPRVGFNIFPPAKDSIAIGLEFTFAPGTDIDAARESALAINQSASDLLGDDLELGYLYLGSERDALAQYRLTPIGGRPTVHELVDRLQTQVGDGLDNGRALFTAISNGPPELLFPYTMQVFGEDFETLAAAGEAMRADLDGRSLELANGEAFEVLETELALVDVVARDGGRRFVEVRARFDNDSTTSVTAATQTWFEDNYGPAQLADLGLEADALGFDFGLESDNQESFSSLPMAFGAALLLMLILLIVQFRSSVQWLLVFLAIPFSFFGVFGGLLATGNVLSFFVMLGLIGLIGIAVNNTILLTDFANQERDAGHDRRTAISNAVRQRFRPLVATSLTTVAGLLPLALSDPFWEALAFTIIFGLLSSTFLVILSFPYYYLAIETLRDRFRTPWRRAAPS